MLVRFRTNGAMNFAAYNYQIVIDACGGGTPYPNPNTTTYLNYTFSFNIGSTTFGPALTTPILVQYIVTPGTSNQLNPTVVRTSTSQITLTPNDNGSNNEFTLTFPRALLQAPLGPSALPCHSSPVSPAPATPTPTGAVPTASPSNLASSWSFNFFVTNPAAAQGTNPVLDSLGSGGPTDNTYNQSVINTMTTNFNLVNKQPDTGGGGAPSDPAAQIAGGEIDNYQ